MFARKYLLPRSLLLGSLFICTSTFAVDGTAGNIQVTATLDENRNEVQLVVTEPDGRSVRSAHELDATVLDGVCNGQLGGNNYLFAFGDNGFLAQWEIADDGRSLNIVRSIPGSLDVEACLVVNGYLYILEEDTALWHYPAHPEAKAERVMVERFAPHGPLPEGAESLQLVGNKLFVDGIGINVAPAAQDWQPDLPMVAAQGQTTPVYHIGDAADDPAIWFNERSPKDSLILGADKRYGLRIYNLQGEETTAIAAGRINNVDLRAVEGNAELLAIAAGSNRSSSSISLFTIDAKGSVEWLREAEINTGLEDPYGLCMGVTDAGPTVIVNDKDGRFQVWQLSLDGSAVKSALSHEFAVADQPEGCVFDEQSGLLYLGVEELGVYTVDLAAPQGQEQKTVVTIEDSPLVADVEGMDIVRTDKNDYLLVSSQGNNSYALFDLQPPHAFRGAFRIGPDRQSGVDGASETDGLAVHGGDFGAPYASGVLVVQDGHNVSPQQSQNFKLVPLGDILETLGLE